MGRRSTGTIEPLRTTIRLKFTWLGARCVETLDLAPTPANIRAAERLMARVQGAIAAGSYREQDFFPKAGHAAPETFKEYALVWLETVTGAKSTKRSYRSALNSTWIPAFGDKRLTEIRHSDIKKAVAAKAAGVSGKTVNNALITVRDVFDMAKRDGLIPTDPTDGIDNLAHQAPEPDPFDRDEVDAILKHMRAKFDAQVANYFEFAFHTGMRPSEIISLRWGDIDWPQAQIRVQRARVDWEEKGTKTNKIRDVNLSDHALDALKRQKACTFMRGADAEVFNNPVTGKPWPDEQVQRRRYFAPTLRALGYRHRDAYQTRHTFATIALMGGINVSYIAKQLGHAKINTTLDRYARWVERADKGVEAAKMNALLSRNRPRREETA
jgi:integrase